MNSETDWVLFESRGDSASAEMLCSQLGIDGVATRIEIHGVPGLSTFNVLVPRTLLHRARWITQQPSPSDTEFEFLATGQLPNAKPEE